MGDDGLTFKEALEHAHRQWEAKVAAQIGEKFEEQLNLADALVAAMDKDLELAPIRGFIYQRPKKHSQTDGSLAAGNRFTGIPVAVAFRHPLKGVRGTVIGDHDSADRAKRLDMAMKARRKHRIDDSAGIMVSIRRHHSNQILLDIPIENLLHTK